MQLAPESLRAPFIRDVLIEAFARELCRSRDITKLRAVKFFSTVHWIHAITRVRHVFLDESLLPFSNSHATRSRQGLAGGGGGGAGGISVTLHPENISLLICTSEE